MEMDDVTTIRVISGSLSSSLSIKESPCSRWHSSNLGWLYYIMHALKRLCSQNDDVMKYFLTMLKLFECLANYEEGWYLYPKGTSNS
ncbi:hypothetical protein SOVF_126180 [Spinacia oleracea]|nr:hypothetical protein SOVF_126180 [Spinacia oleracea]